MARARKPLAAAGMLRGMLAASRLVSLAMSPLARATPPGVPAGRVTGVADFGSNPGGLRMLVYRPVKSPRAGAPLIVVLHGCGQGAARFASDAGWIDLADRLRIPLVLAEQVAANNPNRCFNWYRRGDTDRGAGEALSIRQMVSTAVKLFGSDRRQVFVVGLSAGGAMAVALLVAYPAVFAAGAAVAGMPFGAASTAPAALLRMHRAEPFRSRAGLVAAVRSAAPAGSKRRWPKLSIWQGGRDRTVDPANAEMLAAQWSGLHGLAAEPMSDAAPYTGTRRRLWGRPARPVVELWTLPALAHGFPVDAHAAGGGKPGPWVLDAGIAAAQHIAAFWGIDQPRPR